MCRWRPGRGGVFCQFQTPGRERGELDEAGATFVHDMENRQLTESAVNVSGKTNI